MFVRALVIEKQHVTPSEFDRREGAACYKHDTPIGVFQKRLSNNAAHALMMPNCAISDCEIRGATGKSDFAILCEIEILFAANAFVQT